LNFTTTKITTQRIGYTYCGWWLLWTFLEAFAINKTTGFSWSVAFIDAINMNLILATAGYVMSNSLRYYRPSPKNAFNLLVWSIILAIITVAIQRYLTAKYLLPHDDAYQLFVSNSSLIRGLFSWLMIAFVAIISWIWYYLQDQQAVDRRQEDAERLAREAELSKLRQQLQPHFLFNSLNSISALAGSRPEEARKMIQQLSDFLRGTLKKDDQQLVTLTEELQHLELYLDIEKVRFGHRLKTEITKTDDTEKMALPSLLLQPLVENAIKFGLYDTIGTITIRVTAKTENNYLIIEIENPFDPSTTQPKGTGFGLNSVQRRLHLLYARQDLLTTQQNDSLFITRIKIPQSK
jgi:two-component system LytT family sensor kinase